MRDAATDATTWSARRASSGDRMDTSVGPFRVEVIEGLKRLRVVLEPTRASDRVRPDVWTGAIAAFLEPRHFVRKHGRVVFDTMRLAQTGCWSGTLRSTARRSS